MPKYTKRSNKKNATTSGWRLLQILLCGDAHQEQPNEWQHKKPSTEWVYVSAHIQYIHYTKQWECEFRTLACTLSYIIHRIAIGINLYYFLLFVFCLYWAIISACFLLLLFCSPSSTTTMAISFSSTKVLSKYIRGNTNNCNYVILHISNACKRNKTTYRKETTTVLLYGVWVFCCDSLPLSKTLFRKFMWCLFLLIFSRSSLLLSVLNF